MRLVVLVLLAVGCSRPVSTGTGPTEEQSTCPAGEVLGDDGACHVLCADDSHCDAAFACADGICVPEALVPCDPSSCAEGYTCPASGHDCVAVIPDGTCDENRDCEAGQKCQGGECVSALQGVVATCEDAGDCGLLMTCQNGLCLGCIDDLQCGGGKCVFGACLTADLGPAGECLTLECSEGTSCSPVTGTCTQTCAEDAECGEGNRCAPLLNQCVADYGCESDADCLTNTPMCAGGLCVGCASDAECRPSEKCVGSGMGSVCMPTFESLGPCDNVTCPASETCDPADGSCYPSNGTCVDSTDCRDGQDCGSLHLCTGCSADGDCRSGQRCFFGTCIPIST